MYEKIDMLEVYSRIHDADIEYKISRLQERMEKCNNFVLRAKYMKRVIRLRRKLISSVD